MKYKIAVIPGDGKTVQFICKKTGQNPTVRNSRQVGFASSSEIPN